VAEQKNESRNEENFRWCQACACLFRGNSHSVGVCPASKDGHDGTKSQNYCVHHGGKPAVKAQEGWAVCKKCQVLSFVQMNTGCPAGGNHDHSGGGIYLVAQEAWNGNENQTDWRWCKKCDSLFFGGSIGVAKCSSGGNHTAESSGNYVLGTKQGAAWTVPKPVEVPKPGIEENFRWCYVCACMIRCNSGNGVCVNGAQHDISKSGNYCIHHTGAPNTHQTQGSFGQCTKCNVLTYKNYAGSCWAGGQHTFASAEYFVSREAWNGTANQADWRWCKRCSSIFFGGSIGVAKCPSGQGHTTEDSYTYYPGTK